MGVRTALVTGATGGVGRDLTAALARSGIRVLAVVRPRSAQSRTAQELFALSNVVPVVASLSDEQVLVRAARTADAVVHLAAQTRPAGRLAHRLVTVEGTRCMLRVAWRVGVGRLVHVSSTAVYGPPPRGTGAIVESAPLRGRGAYAEGKVAAELLVGRAVRRGLPAIVLRPSLIYGGRGETGLLALADDLVRGAETSRTGKLDRRMQPVHVDDVVRAVKAALAAPDAVAGPVNVAGPDTVDPIAFGHFLDTITDDVTADLELLPARYSTERLERVLGKRARVRILDGLLELSAQK